MLFTTTKENILTKLNQVANIANGKNGNAILSHILIVVDNGDLILTGSDSEIELVSRIRLDQEWEQGSITVPSKKFLDIIKSFNNNSLIKFKLESDKATISSGKSKLKLSTLPSESYPEFKRNSIDKNFAISSNI